MTCQSARETSAMPISPWKMPPGTEWRNLCPEVNMVSQSRSETNVNLQGREGKRGKNNITTRIPCLVTLDKIIFSEEQMGLIVSFKVDLEQEESYFHWHLGSCKAFLDWSCLAGKGPRDGRKSRFLRSVIGSWPRQIFIMTQRPGKSNRRGGQGSLRF